MVRPEAVIFDWDGVVFDSGGAIKRMRAELADFVGREFYFGGHDAFTSLQKLGLSRRAVNSYSRKWEAIERGMNIKIFPLANAVLKELREKRCLTGIVTNRRKSLHNLRVFASSGLDFGLLDFFIMRDEFCWKEKIRSALGLKYQKLCSPIYRTSEHSKPDPRMIEPISGELRELHDFPTSVWYVGDNLVDAEFARENDFSFAGVMCGSITDREVWRARGVSIVVNGIEELVSALFPPKGREDGPRASCFVG